MKKSKLIHIIFLPLEKTLILHDLMILIKSVLDKNQNHYYYNILSDKCSNQLSKNNDSKWVFMKLWMLYYYRIDVSEGIDSNKTSASKECDICQ